MNIKTDSIIDCIELQTNKSIENISSDDIEKVRIININRIGFDGEILRIDYNDLLYFNNLEELNVKKCMINNICMNNILKIANLKKLNVVDSDFVDDATEFFSALRIENLSIDNCLGISHVQMNDFSKLTLKNVKLINAIGNVNELDISHIGTNIENINIVNIGKLVINEKQYQSNIDILNSISNKIIVINDFEEVVKEINYD